MSIIDEIYINKYIYYIKRVYEIGNSDEKPKKWNKRNIARLGSSAYKKLGT